MIAAYRCLLVCLLCSVARVARAQLTARDTAALVEAVAERIHTRFGTGVAREPFVITLPNPRATPDGGFAIRVSAAVYARDSSLIVAEPTRTTMRIHVGALGLIPGDTVTVTLYIGRCKETPVLMYSGNPAPHAFRRVGNQWAYVERNVGGSGAASSGCPW